MNKSKYGIIYLYLFIYTDYRKEIMRSKKPKKKLETIAYQYSDCPTASKGKIEFKSFDF